MSGNPPFTADDVAKALKAKAQDAFGATVTTPFSVHSVEQHRAEVTYTVTLEPTFESRSRPVRSATGAMYDVAAIRVVLEQRRDQLLNAPGYLRQHALAQLSSTLGRYREPCTFHLLSDNQLYCSVEDCQNCAGRGICTCSACNGQATQRCMHCFGECSVRCDGCNGTGNSTGGTFCLSCGGTGQSAGIRCDRCNGSGRPGHRCVRCHGSGKTICHRCHNGRVTCHACRRGQVTCGTCNGACQLIYEHHLEVKAETSVHYTWGPASAEWMLPAMREAMNSPQCHAIFSVDQCHVESDQANRFTASGHVVAAQADVTHQNVSGTCRFIGTALHPVFLDGVLSGGFKKALEGVKNPEDIHRVNQASSSRIARQLIQDMAHGGDVDQTAPVREGVISAADADEFMRARDLALQHILDTAYRFRWSAVLRLAVVLTALLTAFYGLMTFFSRPAVGQHAWIGLHALWHDPRAVLTALLSPLSQLIEAVIQRRDYGLLAYWLLAALLFNRLFVPRLAPRVWRWADGRLLRAVVLSVPGLLLLDLFMAFYPAAHVALSFSDLLPRGSYSAMWKASVEWIRVYLPQIGALALAIAVLRYPAAGFHWARRMLRILLQRREVSDYLAQLK